MSVKGLILKGIGGFYYVQTAQGIYECRARGIFRKEKITPYAGDVVGIDAENDMKGTVSEIFPRKNYLIRPPVANIDNLFIVVSLVTPGPEPLIIDKTIAAAEMRDISPVVVITKADLGEEETAQRLLEIYRTANIPCYIVSSVTGTGTQDIVPLLQGKVSAFTGNSGAGKSTLLNALFPDFQLKTGEISEKLGRGRHTTREVELHCVGNNSYVADTPGFSTFDIERYEMTDKDQLVYGFREFMPLFGTCKFGSCTHTVEPGCAIAKAVAEGSIAKSRYNSYLAMYQEIKDKKTWQNR